MKKNMGTTDKTIRIILAVAFALFYFTGIVSGTFGIILVVLAIVLLLTSLFGYCPLYAPFGFSTLDKKIQA